jgi:spore cortex formation protein SpoVR/YcgB (stage V sporulation)
VWTYEFVDGVHFFVPTDKRAAGLCVANTDLEAAYNEVGEQLSKIVAFNTGAIEAIYVPAVPLEKFKELIDAYDEVTIKIVSDHDVVPHPTQLWTHHGRELAEVA